MKYLNVAIFAGVAVVVAVASVSADMPFPHRKAGLWQGVTSMGGHSFSTEYCIDAASEAKMSAFSSNMRQKKCSASSITHNMDGSWTSTSTCEFMPGKTMTTHAVITGDFNSKYTVAVAPQGTSGPHMTMTVTWLGPCKPGMKGGDVVMSNGMTMNMMDNSMSGAPK